MNFNDILVPIEKILVWSFGIIESLGNTFNIAVIILGFVGLFIWLKKQYSFNKQAEGNPNQLK